LLSAPKKTPIGHETSFLVALEESRRTRQQASAQAVGVEDTCGLLDHSWRLAGSEAP
jgi:hypothetical protein